jgi:MFS family permease
VGYFFSAISRVGYSLSKTWYYLIPFKVLDRVGKMRDSPGDAYVAKASNSHDRGKNFGFLRMMDHLGATSGVLASLFIFPLLGFRKLFLFASLPTFLSVLLLIFFMAATSLKTVEGLKVKLPHARSIEENPDNIEEERRLFYVAITRAKQKLFMTSCKTRKIRFEIIDTGPSPFLEEIPKELISFHTPVANVKDEEALDYFEQMKSKFNSK